MRIVKLTALLFVAVIVEQSVGLSLGLCAGLPTLSAEKGAPTLIPAQVQKVVLVQGAPAVLVTDADQARYVLIFVDYFMADAIQRGMGEPPLERPLTHDLIGILLGRAGARVRQVTLTDLRGSTYFALISLEVNGERLEIDARPSDALAIAVRQRVPIFVHAKLLQPFTAGGQPTSPPAMGETDENDEQPQPLNERDELAPSLDETAPPRGST